MIAKKVWYCWTGRPSRWGSTQVSLVHCWALRDWERSSPCTSERLPGTLAEAIAAVPRYRPSDEIPRRVPHRHRDLPAMRPAGCASSPASSNRRSLNGSSGTSAVRPAPSIRGIRAARVWTGGRLHGHFTIKCKDSPAERRRPAAAQPVAWPATCHQPPRLQLASTGSAANIGPLVRPIRATGELAVTGYSVFRLPIVRAQLQLDDAGMLTSCALRYLL